MLCVVEISQVRQVVHTHPLNGLLFFNRSVDFLNLWRLSFDSIVAVHTDVCRRNTRLLTFVNARVAISTVNLVLASV